jgi:hypothetical protein
MTSLRQRLTVELASALSTIDPTSIRWALMRGGPAHGQRLLLFAFDDRGQAAAVAKLSRAPKERGFLAREHAALSGVHQVLRERTTAPRSPITDHAGTSIGMLHSSIPEPISLVGPTQDGWVALLMKAVPGQSLDTPDLAGRGDRRSAKLFERFTERALPWSRRLAAATAGPCEPKAALDVPQRFLNLFGERLDRQRAAEDLLCEAAEAASSVETGWQHGHLVFSNTVFAEGGRWSFLDWEHGAEGQLPWTDTCLFVGQCASLANQQRAGQLPATMRSIFAADHWVGRRMQHIIMDSWDHPPPFPQALLFTMAERAVRRADEGRVSNPWAECALALMVDHELKRRCPWLCSP